MSVLLSQLEEARRELLIHRATGSPFDTLMREYTWPRPAGIDREDWQNAVQSVFYGPRGTPGTLLSFLELALAGSNVTFSVTQDPATPARITAPPATFDQPDIGRLYRISGDLYWSVGPPDVGAAGGGFLDLAPLKTGYWSAADWSAFPAPVVVDAVQLPFVIIEPSPGPISNPGTFPGQACLVIVDLYPNNLLGIPPTYLQPTSVVLRPVGQPYGGHLMEDIFSDGSQTVGPYPIYLFGEEVLGAVTDVLMKNLMPICYRLSIKRVV